MAADPLPHRGLLLISGPSRGGKSGWAEHLAHGWSGPVLYLATGPSGEGDPSWQERVELHRDRRPGHWHCLEVGAELVQQLQRLAAKPQAQSDAPPCLLIESLGTWVAWHLEEAEPLWRHRCEALLEALVAQPGPVLLVVEETGWGVVPPTAIGILFRDRLGALQQRLMGCSVGAWLVVAGRALDLFNLGTPVPKA
jgi:adenosylcobinamide kinase/adenosylcobinamide-phosphate guanylyltransferase